MFDIAVMVPQSLRSTVLVLGKAHRKDGAGSELFVLGSGVAIDEEVVLTSNHVNWASADVYTKLEIFVGADDTYNSTSDRLLCFPVAGLSADAPHDLLLMKVPGLKSKVAPLRQQDPEQGELLYWIGHPGPQKMQMAPLVASGIVAAKQLVPPFPRGVSTNVRGLRLDGSALGGNSGGGVFDHEGLLCGLICASPLHISGRHLENLLQSQNGASALIGGVNVVEVLRDFLEELASITRPGIAYAIGIDEIREVLPALRKNLP